MLDPNLAVERSLPEQKGSPHAASHAVIPTGYGGVNEVGTRDRHGYISCDDAHSLSTWTTCIQLVPAKAASTACPCLVFPIFRSWIPNSMRCQHFQSSLGRPPTLASGDQSV